MINFIVLCTLLMSTSVLSAPTSDEPNKNHSKSTFILRAQEKPILEHSQVGSGVFVNAPSTDKREKRENYPASSLDNKRIQINSQPEYQENKPPTFVHPVPVDQIIKNSHAAPQIHSSDHKPDVDREVSNDDEEQEEEYKSVDDDEGTKEEYHKSVERFSAYKRAKKTKTSIESGSDDHSHENR